MRPTLGETVLTVDRRIGKIVGFSRASGDSWEWQAYRFSAGPYVVDFGTLIKGYHLDDLTRRVTVQ